MHLTPRIASLALATTLILSACASQSGPAAPAAQPAAARPSAPTHITISVMSDPPLLYREMAGGTGLGPGSGELESLVAMGMTYPDDGGRQHAILAEDIPSVENGGWVVNADGTMRTTWKIRSGAKWHDGTPVTSDDLMFTVEAQQDRDLPFTRHPAYDYVDHMEANGPQGITVFWKRPYIDADTVFNLPPLPRHLLEAGLRADKAGWVNLPYWRSAEFIGTGPFRVEQWERGSHLLLKAHDGYALGRPKIDEVEVKLFLDPNTVVANILAGAVDLTIGQSVSLQQGLQIRDQWANGHIETWVDSSMKVWPQFVNPNPVIVTDLVFRRALMYTTDRQSMADTIMAGISSVADSTIQPNEPEYPEAQAAAVKYPYDPTRAAQMFESLGLRKGADGSYRDSSDQRLTVQILASPSEENLTSMQVVGDLWQRSGIGTELVPLPTQRRDDVAYRANFPAFSIQAGPGVGMAQLQNLHGSEARLPEKNYRGRNFSRYQNPEFDALLDRYATTIPHADRLNLVGQIIHHMTDNLNVMTLFFVNRITLVGNRLDHAGANPTWNAYEWTVK